MDWNLLWQKERENSRRRMEKRIGRALDALVILFVRSDPDQKRSYSYDNYISPERGWRVTIEPIALTTDTRSAPDG